MLQPLDVSQQQYIASQLDASQQRYVSQQFQAILPNESLLSQRQPNQSSASGLPRNKVTAFVPSDTNSRLTPTMHQLQLKTVDTDNEEEQGSQNIYNMFKSQCERYLIGIERIREFAQEHYYLLLEATQTRIEMLESYHKRIHDKANMVESNDVLMPRLSSEFQAYMLDVDQLYFEVKTLVRQRQAELTTERQSTSRNSGGHRSNPADELSLQRVQIEKFAGDSVKWPNFKCHFEQFFHNNAPMTDAAKFIRLDALIKENSEPYGRISGLTRDPGNYQKAWALLCRTYDNKRKLIDDIIDSFIDMPPMKAARRDELIIVVNGINNVTGSLSRYDVQHWDAILVNLALRKIDEETLDRWKHERPSREIAKLGPLIAFLENRAESMRNAPTQTARGGSASNSTTNSAPQRNNQTRSVVANQSAGAAGGQPSKQYPKRPVICKLCSAPHQLFACADFRKLDVEVMWTKAEQYRVCKKCLKPGCHENTCRMKNCPHCGAPHNGLLCRTKARPSVAVATDQTN